MDESNWVVTDERLNYLIGSTEMAIDMGTKVIAFHPLDLLTICRELKEARTALRVIARSVDAPSTEREGGQ